MTSTVTFIGLGTMGQPMAQNLAQTVPVAVYDTNSEAVAALEQHGGITGLTDPAAALTADPAGPHTADTLILMLPNSAIVAKVLGDVNDPASLAARLRPGTLVIDMGSSAPQETTKLADHLHQRSVAFVDAPVSGGPRKAATAELTIMAGGTDEDVQRAMPFLRAMGTSVIHAGPVGAAHALKALNNLLSAIGLVGALEVLTVGARFGLDPKVMLDVINKSTGRNQATEVKIGPEVLDGRFGVGFSLALTVKDIRTALELSKSLGMSPEVAEACVKVCEAALTDLDDTNPDQTEIARYLAKTTGVDLSQ
ncbi:NAD(P)-dependent oxidoreductase [Streptomyces albidoflavus]|uniref:NAD(P)-dependent oxidoreductase n=1 Tax=Streptomyces albidoflavus TaxID=1886 RepID=UPI00101E33A1|nr:NAD(P)-dependent oxidoreductase [Streptomyces albidoflavus]RZD76771.1 NAD(P)-dependent oxidoreductase [Streptomyces albidoflavus]